MELHIHGSQMMYRSSFGNPVTVSPVPLGAVWKRIRNTREKCGDVFFSVMLTFTQKHSCAEVQLH